MENNEQEKTNNTVNDSKFKTVSNPGTYRTVYEMDNKPKKNSNFGRTIVVPFISGVVGCAVVLGTCFGVTSFREQILGTDGSSSSSSSSSAFSSPHLRFSEIVPENSTFFCRTIDTLSLKDLMS